ncbi:MAG: hypothetical protein ABEJ65_05690, partial [bacterium]
MKFIRDNLSQLQSDRGTALVLVLWMMALLGAIVSAYSLNAMLHIQVSSALSNLGMGYDLATAGAEAWMGQLRADALQKPDDIVVTEVMNYWPRQPKPIKITQICDDSVSECDNDYVQVFNSHHKAAYVTRLAEVDYGDRWSGEIKLESGEYQVFCEGTCDVSGSPMVSTKDVSTLTPGNESGYQVWGRLSPDDSVDEYLMDVVGYDATGSNSDVENIDDSDVSGDVFEGDVVAVNGEVNIMRDTKLQTPYDDHCGDTIPSKCKPVDSDNNANDFLAPDIAMDPGDTGFWAPPADDPPEQNEFIEIYNTTGSAIDPTDGTYKFTDALNGSGESTNSSEYTIAHYDTYPSARNNNPKLKSQMEGVIVNIRTEDTSAMDVTDEKTVKDLANNGDIRLYYLVNSDSNEPEFLTGGLHNDKLEDLTFIRGGGGNKNINMNGWNPESGTQPVQQGVSWEKGVLTGDNSNARDNWYHGGKTPGIVSGGDNFDELWGWGGEIIEGTPMDKKVCLPSQTVYTEQSGCDDGDIGYFQMEYIEDEAGKANLLDSSRTQNGSGSVDTFDEFQLYVEDSGDFRDMHYSKPEEVIQYANGSIGDSSWLTPGEYFTRDSGGNRIITSSIDSWEQYSHLY